MAMSMAFLKAFARTLQDAGVDRTGPQAHRRLWSARSPELGKDGTRRSMQPSDIEVCDVGATPFVLCRMLPRRHEQQEPAGPGRAPPMPDEGKPARTRKKR